VNPDVRSPRNGPSAGVESNDGNLTTEDGTSLTMGESNHRKSPFTHALMHDDVPAKVSMFSFPTWSVKISPAEWKDQPIGAEGTTPAIIFGDVRLKSRTNTSQTSDTRRYRAVQVSSPPPSPPPAPTGLTATGGMGQIGLNWDPVPEAISYRLKRSASSTGTCTTIANGILGTSYVISALGTNATWYYKVSSVNAVGEGPESAVVSATTDATLPPLAQGNWPAGHSIRLHPLAFTELQVIDHWNLRYTPTTSGELNKQVAQIMRNMDIAAFMGFQSYLLFQKDAFSELLSWSGRKTPHSGLRASVQQVLTHATNKNLKLYLHANQFEWPSCVGVAYKDTLEAWATYSNAVVELITLFPGLAGYQVTADETTGALKTKEAVLKFHNVTARALQADGVKRLALMRTWQRVGFLGSPSQLGLNDDPNVHFSVKNTKGDFRMINGFESSFFDAVPTSHAHRLMVEFEAWREYETHGIFPLYLGDYWAPRFRAIADRGIQRVGVRFNWNSGQMHITERPWANWVNVFTFRRLAENPHANPDTILNEFVSIYYPRNAHATAFKIYKASFNYVKALYYDFASKGITDHGRVNRPDRISGRRNLGNNWIGHVDARHAEMVAVISALQDGTPYKQELLLGAQVAAWLAKCCGKQWGASGMIDFLDQWEQTSKETYDELRADLMR